jgi:hypothetical protein
MPSSRCRPSKWCRIRERQPHSGEAPEQSEDTFPPFDAFSVIHSVRSHGGGRAPDEIGAPDRACVRGDRQGPGACRPTAAICWWSSRTPDFTGYARACSADGYAVDTEDQFEQAFAAALASARPSVIDARITRWAVPHYGPAPDGVIDGLVEMIEERFRDESPRRVPFAAHNVEPEDR